MRIRGPLLVSLILLVLVLLFWQRSGERVAVIGDIVLPTATVFPAPAPVVWDGQVLRSLAGGRGLELKGEAAPGGYFFAYKDEGFPASLSSGFIRIRGLWQGISCEYGRCAPEVDAESIEITKTND